MLSGILDFLAGSSDKRASYEEHIRPILQHTGRPLTHADCFHWLDQKVVIHLQRFDRPQIGTVKYIGSDDKGVLCAGVEFEYNIGGMAGKINGQKLFKCKQGHGLLVPVEYVRLLADYENGTNIFPLGQPASSSSSSSSSHQNSTTIHSNAPTIELHDYISHTLPDLKVGENVVWLGGSSPQTGVVKWIGRVGRNNQTPIKVWMEMDEFMAFGRNEIDVGTKFGCAPGRGKFLPVEELILLANFIPVESTNSRNSPTTVEPLVQDKEQSSHSPVSPKPELPNVVNDLIDLSEDNNLSVKNGCDKSAAEQDFVNLLNNVDDVKLIGNKRSSIDELVNTIPSKSQMSNTNIWPQPETPTSNTPLETDEFGLSSIPSTNGGEVLQNLETDVNGNVSQEDLTQGGIVMPARFPVQLISENETEFLPPFIVPPINIVEFFKAEGLKGIQGKRNSCYIDVVLFSMFAFTDTFDPYFLVKSDIFCKVPDSVITKTAKKIMSEKIVNPLRQNYYCSAVGVNSLRELMIPFSDKLDGAFLDIEEFMLILFDKVFQLKEFILYDNGVKDYLHQINLGDHSLPPVMTVKQCLEMSMIDYKLKLENVPSPAFIIQIPRHHSGIIQSTTIVPNLSIDLKNVLKPSETGSMSSSVMNLVAVICINDFHFVTFVKSGNGVLSHWVLFDSNPSEEVPKVEIVSNMGEYLEMMEHQCLTNPQQLFDTKHKFPPYVARLLSDIYVCIYCPSNSL